MNRLLSTLFWSVIAAAFIGPGTITTAASAGAGFGHALLWALTFSTLATIVLQEACARVTIVSGLNLGQALQRQYAGGVRGFAVLVLVVGAIVFGCAAYEAGNILGGVEGAALGTGLPRGALTLVTGLLAGGILWFGSVRAVAYVLSLVVAAMGVAFLVTAVGLEPPPASVLRGSLVPALPPGSDVLVLGLIGTTVVPYNLFLGSGIAAGQDLAHARFGLAVSIGLGGIISMAVVVVGSAIAGAFSYEGLAATLSGRLGGWAAAFFAFGLFAAGFSSAVTAPLAAAVTARSLFEAPGRGHWRETGWRYRTVWAGVLLTGVAFGLAGVRPIPAIVLAQALNGVVLPVAAIMLMLVVNDRRLMGASHLNGPLSNAVMALVVAVTVLLGAASVLRALASAAGFTAPAAAVVLGVSAAVALLVALPLARAVRRRRAAR